MIKSKSKLILIAMIITGIAVFISCKKEEKNLDVNDTPSIAELKDNQIEYIGKMHNVYVERAYKDYFVKLRAGTNKQEIILDILDLISFFERQPESKDISVSDINKIKEFYYNFKTNKNSSLSYSEQLLEYIKLNVEKMYGINYDKIISTANTRATLDNKINNTLIGVALSVNKNSEMFWREFHGVTSHRAAPGSATIAADTAGALWGLLFGPAGSIIAGGVASIAANEIEHADGDSPVFDGEIHTPKEI